MYRDRVCESSQSLKFENFILAGAKEGYRTFQSAFDNNIAYYAIINDKNPKEWELGSAKIINNVLIRNSEMVISGSAGVKKLTSFSSGNKTVMSVVPKRFIESMNSGHFMSRRSFFRKSSKDGVVWMFSAPVIAQVFQQFSFFRRKENHFTAQIANCAGVIPNSNCASDSFWSMPDGNWWTWGLGLTPGNPSGFDFAGGSSIGYVALGTINSAISNSEVFDHTDTGTDYFRTDWKNCNCGATNCYNNCNCNCNCACACDCACNC